MHPFVLLAILAGGGCTSGDDTSGDDTSPPDDTPPEWCEEAIVGGVQHVLTHPGSPYWIHHPASGEADVPTVVFLPGGPGADPTGEGTYHMFFERGSLVDEFRVVIVTAMDGDLTDEWERVPVVTDEVLACYGGSDVHLSGTSNGGLGAFETMLTSYDRYATLLGCPGVWMSWDGDAVAAALAGRTVFNGVGALDSEWQPYMEQTHERLLALGIDSVYEEFEGQGHVPDATFDPDVLFEFWLAH
jgi:predicted esterase